MLATMTEFLAILVYFVIASGVHIVAKKINLPYTILLFVTGLVLIPLTIYVPGFHILDEFQLTPDLLFFVFLPVLIFESGYNIKHQILAKNSKTIRTLATVGLLIAMSIIGFGTYFITQAVGLSIPLEVTLLFGVIISATDPVAVLSIFKKLWTPHRLNLLFEGESLFNDGTAVAIFLVLIEIFRHGVFDGQTIALWLVTLVVMILWWILVGITVGIIFSKVIQQIKNNEVVEISLTMILAHAAFIFAEYLSEYVVIGGRELKISWVIATAFAAIIMGNYGRTKISPRVESYMDKFWNFFAFLCNSLIFLLMGLMVKDINVPLEELLFPLFIGILMVIIGRAVSIYVPIGIMNIKKSHEHIPLSWQHLMARGSLRGALWLVLVLLIPNDFTIAWWQHVYSIKEFLLAMVIGAIMFSLIIKGLTIKGLIQKLKLDKLHVLEWFEKLELDIMVYQKIIEKISFMKEEYHIAKKNYDELKAKYIAKHDEAVLEMQLYLQQLEKPDAVVSKALWLHALGIEKQYLKEMFEYNECNESIYMHMLGRIERQILRVEKWAPQIKKEHENEEKTTQPRLEKLIDLLHTKKHKDCDTYVIARARYIVTSKVINALQKLKEMDFGYKKSLIEPVIALYQEFNNHAHEEMEAMTTKKPYLVNEVNKILLNKWLMKTEERIVKDFWKKEMITSKLYKHFMNEVEKEILRDV